MSKSKDPLVVGRIVGDILDPFTKSVSLSISYSGVDVSNGCFLKPSLVSSQPAVEIAQFSRGLYTLVMVDPDAPNPSEPTMREYLLWLVTNIPGGSEVGEGQVMVAHESPNPTVGIHRVVFAVFEQQGGRQAIDAPGWRQNFRTRDFAEVYNLGRPVAALYFNCQRELKECVDSKRRRLPHKNA